MSYKKLEIKDFAFLVALTAVAIATRLLPHAPNFTAVGALALFAGAKFSKRWAWFVPLLVMLASDAMIGFYDWRLMAVVYASFLVFAGIGQVVSSTAGGEKKNGSGKHSNILQNVRMFFATEYAIRIGCASLAGSTLFFFTTNFAVWFMSDWYPKTLGGLMLSYAYGVPFFRNMVFGDLLYTGVFFGAYALLSRFWQRIPSFALRATEGYPAVGGIKRSPAQEVFPAQGEFVGRAA